MPHLVELDHHGPALRLGLLGVGGRELLQPSLDGGGRDAEQLGGARAAAWVCSLLGATKRMVGRWAASQIASASVALFFCRLTNGLTYAGGISRTACPSMPISRAQ